EDADDVDASGEQLRLPHHAERRHIAAVGAAPEPDPPRVNLGPLAEPARGGDDVAHVTATDIEVGGDLVVAPIAPRPAVVDIDHDVALLGQHEIGRVDGSPVGVTTPAGQHELALPAAVDVDHRR